MKTTIIILSFICNSICSFGQNQTVPDSLYPSSDLIISYHSEWAKNHYPKKIKEFKKNPLNHGDIVFLGNSITQQGNNWAERFNIPIVKNRGIAGDVTEGVLKRIAEINYFKPRAVFILIGINDLFQGKSSEFVANNINEIVKTIHKNSRNTKVYVQTILPTKHDSLVDKIRNVNQILKKNKAVSNYKLINLHDLFMDAKDHMKKEYTVDGVHLNKEGYKIWVNEVKDQVVSESKRKNK